MSLGIPEIILIAVVIILLFGGKRIPELAKALGRASYEYKKAKNIIQNEADEIKETIKKEAEKQEEFPSEKV